MFRLIVGILLAVPVLGGFTLFMTLDDVPHPPSPPTGVAADSAVSDPAGGIVNVQATIELPPEFPRRYLNVELDADRETGNGAVIRRVGVGAVDVPGWMAKEAMRWAAGNWPELKDERVELAAIRALESYPDSLELACAWPGTPVERLRIRAIATEARRWPVSYGQHVAEWAGNRTGPRAPFLELLRSLFGEAATRTAAGADPVVENRAAILVAAAQAFGCTPVQGGEPVGWVRPMLHGRDDLGRHFIGSALLAALLDQGFSDVVGLGKEFSDARDVSGFSFSDLAANRAGSQFGDLATASVQSARSVQVRLEQAETDTDIMPAVRDLPDHLPEEELKRRFGEPGAKEYQQVLKDIEARIAGVPLYRVSK